MDINNVINIKNYRRLVSDDTVIKTNNVTEIYEKIK